MRSRRARCLPGSERQFGEVKVQGILSVIAILRQLRTVPRFPGALGCSVNEEELGLMGNAWAMPSSTKAMERLASSS